MNYIFYFIFYCKSIKFSLKYLSSLTLIISEFSYFGISFYKALNYSFLDIKFPFNSSLGIDYN